MTSLIDPRMQTADQIKPDSTFKNSGTAHASVLDFWKWSYIDLKQPTNRGNLAEYLVYLALKDSSGAISHYESRKDWDVCDLTYGFGIHGEQDADAHGYFCVTTGHGWMIEVKSSASTSKKQLFDLKPTQGFLPSREKNGKGEAIDIFRRWSDLYVLAYFNDNSPSEHHSVLDLDNWKFVVVPTATIEQNSINWSKLSKSESYSSVSFSRLRAAIEKLLASPMKSKMDEYKEKNDKAKRAYFEGNRDVAIKTYSQKSEQDDI